MSDYRIIDADGHVMELDEQLREHIGPPYRDLECYPHERDQRDFSQDIPALRARADITDESRRRIFFDNALRFYPRLRARVESRPALTAAS